ncbi:hypothetical protein [Halorussus pelagicus]|nr:hypothetical protein [Halorussus pelagicus]
MTKRDRRVEWRGRRERSGVVEDSGFAYCSGFADRSGSPSGE